MAKWFEKELDLSSLDLHAPNLTELLLRRMLKVSPWFFIFHIGMIGCLVTGIIFFLTSLVWGLSSLFSGWGWIITWIHGVFGGILIIGGLGIAGKYIKDKYFRLAYGKKFFVDAAFISALSAMGGILALKTVGVMSVGYSIESGLHNLLVYIWLPVSFFIGGGARHAFATLYRNLGPVPEEKFSFSDACGNCGRCINVCPVFTAFGEERRDAPNQKLKNLRQIMEGSLTINELKDVVEDTYVCSFCGLCVGVCPYSFDHVNLYKELLGQVDELSKKTVA